MIRLKSYVIVFFCLIFIGCKYEADLKLLNFNIKGDLYKLTELNETSVLLEKYSNGDVDSTIYESDVVEGYILEKDGNIFYLKQVKAQMREGLKICYDADFGKLMYYGEFFQDKKYGEWLFYNDENNLTYEYYGLDSLPVYVKSVNDNGDVFYDKGDAVWLVKQGLDLMFLNDTNTVRFASITPPINSKLEIFFKNYEGNKVSLDNQKDCIYNIDYVVKDTGNLVSTIIWEITDTVNNTFRSDSVSFSVLVNDSPRTLPNER